MYVVVLQELDVGDVMSDGQMITTGQQSLPNNPDKLRGGILSTREGVLGCELCRCGPKGRQCNQQDCVPCSKTKTTAPRIPMWSPTMVLTERYPT